MQISTFKISLTIVQEVCFCSMTVFLTLMRLCVEKSEVDWLYLYLNDIIETKHCPMRYKLLESHNLYVQGYDRLGRLFYQTFVVRYLSLVTKTQSFTNLNLKIKLKLQFRGIVLPYYNCIDDSILSTTKVARFKPVKCK